MVRVGFSYEDAISLQDFVGTALGLKDTPLDSAIDAVEGVDHLDPVQTVPDLVLSLLAVFCEAIAFDANNIASMTQAHPEFVGIIFEEDEGYSEKMPASVGLGKGQDEVVRQMNVFLSDVDAAVRQRTWAEAVERQLT
jgi:hypothetical protein